MSRRKHTYVANSPPLTEKGEFKATSQDQSVNPDWWDNKVERDSSVLTSSDTGVNTTRVQLLHNKKKAYATTQTLEYDIVQTIGAKENVTDGSNPQYYKETFRDSELTVDDDPKDGIYANFDTGTLNRAGEPLKDVEKSAALAKFKIPAKVKVPIKAYDGRTKADSAGTKYYGQERLPFSIYSSSIDAGYQSKLSAMPLGVSVESLHIDVNPATNESSMQGPFAERNVGGNMYRHNDVLESDPTARAEGFRINIDTGNAQISVHNPKFVDGVYDSAMPNGALTREETAKRPINVKNVRTSASIAGNYQKDYQIVLTNDRSINNRNFVSGGLPTTTSVEALTIGWDSNNQINELALLDRDKTGSSNHIIVSRFVGGGGPEEESEGFLDFNSAQYSPYSVLTYRNLVQRNALNELYSRHSAQFGYDGIYGSPWPAFHKTQRNTVVRPHRHFHSSSNKAEYVYDNAWVTHGIPRSDVQYKWINDSWIAKHDPSSLQYLISNFGDVSTITSSEFLPLFGHQYSASIDSIAFVSASEFVSYNGTLGSDRFDDNADIVNLIPTDFVNLNYHVYEPVTGSTLGHEPGTSIVTYINEDLITELTSQATASLLNTLLNNRNGPYGWPTWKQIRVADHAAARFSRKNNFFQTQNEALDPATDKVSRKIVSFQQAPVSSKHHAVQHELADSILKYEFGNNYNFFGEVYDLETKKLINYNQKFGVAQTIPIQLIDYLTEEVGRVAYAETVYPRDENAYRDKTRLRSSLTSFWRDKIENRFAVTVVGSQNQEFSGSIWPLDVLSSSTGEERSGELMRPDNCDLYDDEGYGPCEVPPTGEEVNARFGRFYGTCRPQNQVHESANRGPFHDKYDDFAEDVRLIAQGYGLVPEFTISDYVYIIGDEYGFDFYQGIYDIQLPGAQLTPPALTSSATLAERDARASGKNRAPNQNEFYETFVHSDIMQNIDRVRGNYGEPISLSVTFNGALKLLPRDGFYPVQRTLDLATQFSQSYQEAEADGTEASWRTLLTPFYAPGIMYNSIRAGIAVDYPIVDQESVELDITSALEDCTGGYLKRLPFESIVEPDFYAKQLKGSGSGDFLKIYDFDLEMPLDSTGTFAATNGIYERMAHNFFAEVPEFFLKKLTHFKSKPTAEWSFKGPLRKTTEVKKFVMDVVIEKTANFAHHEAPKWFGPFPHIAHVPPYYTIGASNTWCGTVSDFDCDTFTHIGTNEANKATARIIFDPTPIYDNSPERFINGKFTLEDIVNNSTVEFTNQNMGASVSPFAMSTSASFDLFGFTNNSEWIINSKWEAPVLNFVSVTTTGSNLNSPRGIWNQHSSDAPFADEGLFFNLVEPDISIDDKESSLTGSLIEACGFSIEKQRLGEIATKKKIHEAIVAVPFFSDNSTGEEKLLHIPLELFEEAYQSNADGKPITNSISDMILKMGKYNLLPAHDFVRVRDKSSEPILQEDEYKPAINPFAMLIFEFSHTLTQRDLVNIWQGVMPKISTDVEMQDITMNIPIGDKELFGAPVFERAGLKSMPSNLRWKIYKAKFRAANNYYEMKEKKFDIVSEKRDIDFSYNWPYDFFSLVEMGKMKTQLNFEHSPSGSRNRR